MDKGKISEVIELAWDDEVSFDAIEAQTGLSEPEVIEIMRSNMKRSSFHMWRERVTGRIAKHDKRTRHEDRQSIEDQIPDGFVLPPNISE